LKILKAWEPKAKRKLDEILRRAYFEEKVEKKVKRIIEDVRKNGNSAVIKYTKRFDGASLKSSNLRVSPQEIIEAYGKIEKEFLRTADLVRKNIINFYKREVSRKSWLSKGESDIILGQNYEAIEKIGIYVPGGKAPLVSSLLMSGVLAKVARVKKVIMVSPPGKDGALNPYLLVTANKIGIDEIYKVGGAQAIAALAFGTESIPKVDKIVGPGNKYVVSAKRQVFGYVGIEMLPGPSEVVILADGKANPSFVLSDLAAQAEHLEGLSILITTSQRLAKKVKGQVKNCYIILAKNLKKAAQIVNEIAPEHLEIMVENPLKVLPFIRNAGAIFLGPWTPVAVGDYAAGPSHILPTGGRAKFSSGLSLEDFQRKINIIFYNKKALKKVKRAILILAKIEGMKAHANSVKIRL
jgi:histidinol dehydrogenase